MSESNIIDINNRLKERRAKAEAEEKAHAEAEALRKSKRNKLILTIGGVASALTGVYVAISSNVNHESQPYIAETVSVKSVEIVEDANIRHDPVVNSGNVLATTPSATSIDIPQILQGTVEYNSNDPNGPFVGIPASEMAKAHPALADALNEDVDGIVWTADSNVRIQR